MKRLIRMLLIPVLLPWTAMAAAPLSLEQAIRLALEHAPAYLADAAKRDAAREDVILARAWLLPYVRGTGSYTRMKQNYSYDQGLAFPLPTQLSYGDTKLSVELIQPLFHYDRWSAWQQGRLADEAAALGLKLARQGLILEVASRFADVAAARARLEAVKAKHAAMRRLAEMTDARMEAGLATITEKLEAESRASLTEAELLDARKADELARARLASLIGTAIGPDVPLRLPTPAPTPQQDIESRAGEQALSVLLAEKQFELSDREVDKAVGSALPSVDLVAGYTREKTTDGLFGAGSVRRDQRIGIQVDVPIYAGGGTWAQLRKSKKQKLEAELRLADARREAVLTAREAALNLKAARARTEALKRAVKAAREARNAAQTSYEVGLMTIVDLLDAESRLADARSQLAAAESGLLLTRLQLAASIGGLDTAHLPLGHGEAEADDS